MTRTVRTLERGFTILEIMLATAILVIGLLGLLALFPVAMKLGKMTIEETNGVLIAQSVEQAIRDGMQNRKGHLNNGATSYFIFQHDGVEDAAPILGNMKNVSAQMDYFILLPDPDDDVRSEVSRNDAYTRGKLFVYPESDGKTWTPTLGGDPMPPMSDEGASPNGGGRVSSADDDKDDYDPPPTPGNDDPDPTYLVKRVWTLSDRFFEESEDDDEELQAEPDPISQYSYAFTVRPAYRDASLGRSYPNEERVDPSGELYEFEILVYRSFAYIKELENVQEPVYSRTILVHR
ncbi:MAG: hypothetical protein ACYTGJ_08015 [Planctomycetota bacterium]|jgi:type II secretory pathway pseudopilin PulG